MADDAGHKAMLYYLEILMNSPAPLTISQLAGHFGSRSFTAEMRQSAGGNETGLKKFLLKYPSLFKVNGNLVSLNDGTASLGTSVRESSPASPSSSLPDVSVETEAVNYFRNRMVKKKEKWVHIKSLAGHLSQASAEIRECVGPQNEFESWLMKHPLIFVIEGELVGLKDNYLQLLSGASGTESFDIRIPNDADSRYPSSTDARFTGASMASPRTPVNRRKRPTSLHMDHPNSGAAAMVQRPVSLGTPSSKAGPVTMTANEYKAVMFLKNTIEKKVDITMTQLTGHFSQAPESLRNTVGWSKTDLEAFIQQHANIFILLEGGKVTLKKNARLNVIITGSRPQTVQQPSISNRKGRIFHVAKLWAIIDLGRHEHVFIDRQIFGKSVEDLGHILSPGEMVCFDAVAAPKGSRAKWRASKVWKENESIEEMIERVSAKLDLNLDKSPRDPITPLGNIEDEMKKILPDFHLSNSSMLQSPTVNIGGVKYAFNDAAPSGAGVIPVWNFKHVELEGLKDVEDLDLDDSLDSDSPNVSMVAERYFMNRSVLSDSPRETPREKKGETTSANSSDSSLLNGDAVKQESMRTSTPTSDTTEENSKTERKKSSCTIGCQTIVTGEILATQLFHEDL
ncbi:uncharacterized protein LOC135470538 [Liolophura sinensis]|uniref:uncharacterized protein LOC135470538 n=1 Tax=Liolophura sinensis TaxID=3198878 RepID=UPI0031590112